MVSPLRRFCRPFSARRISSPALLHTHPSVSLYIHLSTSLQLHLSTLLETHISASRNIHLITLATLLFHLSLHLLLSRHLSSPASMHIHRIVDALRLLHLIPHLRFRGSPIRHLLLHLHSIVSCYCTLGIIRALSVQLLPLPEIVQLNLSRSLLNRLHLLFCKLLLIFLFLRVIPLRTRDCSSRSLSLFIAGIFAHEHVEELHVSR
ncbi:hypothetical protein T484DRAFT_1955942 [Baffinella frigidus]|nr:hypothetical protein T484DRAFT_1955942 [Cryptophyta sp. CCMP2293]